MLYFLYEQFNINLFFYISFRASIAFVLAFAFSVFAIPKFIVWAKRKKATQPIYFYAPDGHKEKKNTPTMGGVLIVIGILFPLYLGGNKKDL